MIAPARSRVPAWHAQFLVMLPRIIAHAKIAFRGLRAEARAEKVQEVDCNALVAFARLFQKSRADIAYAGPLARYGVAQVRDGRRVGTKLNCRDVSSEYAQKMKGICLQWLDKYDPVEDSWQKIILIPAIAAIAAAIALPHLRPVPAPITIHSQGPTVERLQRLLHLVTMRVCVADVLVGNGDGCRGSWLIRGDALIAVNLRQAKITARDEETRQATIILPQPEVLQPQVDHQRSRTWQVERLAWLPWTADPDRLRDEVMLQAQEMVAQAAASRENIQQARTTAETILKAIYAEVGWQVIVTWASPPAASVSLPTGESPVSTDLEAGGIDLESVIGVGA